MDLELLTLFEIFLDLLLVQILVIESIPSNDTEHIINNSNISGACLSAIVQYMTSPALTKNPIPPNNLFDDDEFSSLLKILSIKLPIKLNLFTYLFI